MTVLERISEYRSSQNINQSSLVSLINEPRENPIIEEDIFYRKEEELTMGNGFDCLMTHPKYFDELFFMMEEPKPGDKMYDLIMELWTDYPSMNGTCIADWDESCWLTFDAVAEEKSFGGSNWKVETRRNSLLKKGAAYWDAMCSAVGKTIITVDQKMQLEWMVENMKTHRFTKWYTTSTIGESYYQYPLYVHYGNYWLKGLLDRIIVNEYDKSIRIIDYKATDNVKTFPSKFRKYKGYIQGSFYYFLAQEYFPDYEVLLPEFHVASYSKQQHPLVYTMTKADVEIGQYGALKLDRKYYNAFDVFGPDCFRKFNLDILGWEQLLRIRDEHRRLDMWDTTLKTHNLNGKIELNLFANDY